MALCPGQAGWASTRKVKLIWTAARDSEWQWHQLGHVQISTLLQTDNHASTPPLSFYRPGVFPPPNQVHQSTEGNYNYYYTTTVLRLSGLCPWQHKWADTRRNIHSLTPIVVLHRPVGVPTGWYPNIVSLFAIFWSKMKITQADAPTD